MSPKKSKDQKERNSNMKVDDEIRLSIMDALTDEAAAKPNIEYIAEKTGLSRRTIYNSLEFLKDNKVFSGFTPVIDKARLGFNITKICLLNVDLSKEEGILKMKADLINNPRCCWFSDIIASDAYNFISMSVYRSIDESHHLSGSCCNYSDLVKGRQFFYLDTDHEHLHKNVTPVKCAIKQLLEKKESQDNKDNNG